MSFETSLTRLIVSKALKRSKKQAPAVEPESKLHLISSTNVIAASLIYSFENQTKNPTSTCFFRGKLKIVYELPLLSTQQIEWKQDGNFQFL